MAFMPGRTNVRFWVKVLVTLMISEACILKKNLITPFSEPISLFLPAAN